MIELTEPEKKWILVCKCHISDKYPHKDTWLETLKPLFIEIYGWNPDEDNNYHDYCKCLFNKLLDLYLKIIDEQSMQNSQLKHIFSATFYKGSSYSDSPIERAINSICGLIQFTRVIDNTGNFRYDLEIKDNIK